MTRYVALLRGINISGKNKIPMAELKAGFAALGFANVATCLNSGNVVFSCNENDVGALSGTLRSMVTDRFGLDIPVFVIAQEALKTLLAAAPDWWGSDDRELYDQLIFLLPPLESDAFCAEMGEPKAEYERAQPCGSAVFWSFIRKEYQKTSWWAKTANSAVAGRITIRTANTARKLAAL